MTENRIQTKEWNHRMSYLGRMWGKKDVTFEFQEQQCASTQNKAGQRIPLHCLLIGYCNPTAADPVSTFLQQNLLLQTFFFDENRDSRTHIKAIFNL